MPKGIHSSHARGQRHHRWNRGVVRSSHGYVKIRVGVSHPLANPNGYAYEHLVVWCSAGKPRPRSDQVIHHTNGEKTDNRIENLRVIRRGSHNSIHNGYRGRDELGRFKKAAGRLLDGKVWDQRPEAPRC